METFTGGYHKCFYSEFPYALRIRFYYTSFSI
jgi:hypothetical protein